WLTMVSCPSGLLTFRVKSRASRTVLRSIRILLLALFSIGVAVAAARRERTLLVYGDSLSAADALRADEGVVAQLQARLREPGYGYRAANASVGGEPPAGGRARLLRALDAPTPDLAIRGRGANEGLRPLPVKDARTNLGTMIQD